MQLPEIERRILESLVREGGLSVVDADQLQRSAPLARDTFDELLFRATRFAFDEGDWDHFERGVTQYRNLTRHSSQLTPQFIPPALYRLVISQIADYNGNYGSDEPLADGSRTLTRRNQQVGERLLLRVGGDYGDGVGAAGRRTFSHMMAARISDGFAHPAVGGHLWGKYLAVQTGPLPGGPHVAIMRDIGRLSREWISTPAERPRIERTILDHAHRHSWTGPDIER
ncbi:hypothetical protein ACPXCG_21520 [Gordonia sp. DT218]|uniref:hypothetical protein n=1 Tax=Gordonia sp. DT218 TaxID=3416659 RepID=UPI003CF3928A